MKINTIFNPTANGPLHIGHLYCLLVNLAETTRDGTCICIFNDISDVFIQKMGYQKMREYGKQAQDDLDWMGLSPVYDWMSNYSHLLRQAKTYDMLSLEERCLIKNKAKTIPRNDQLSPYIAYETAFKTLIHKEYNINLRICACDLITEYHLYCHFCILNNYNIPETWFIPRLISNDRELYDISKSSCNHKISDYRSQGYTPKDIIELLKRSCLINTELGFRLNNIKQRPSL